MTSRKLLGVAALAVAAMANLACGNEQSAVTAPDVDAAVTAVLSELPSITAEVHSRSGVLSEGERACGLLHDVDTPTPVGDVMAALLDETWADPVETDFHPEEIQDSFIGLVEGPYVVSLARHFCPDQAVRLNII